MELLLLGAGAVVLIAITLWIVWPTPTADGVGTSVSNMEVSPKNMTEVTTPTPPPPLHAVPTQEPVASTRGQRWPEASTDGARIGQAALAENFLSTPSLSERSTPLMAQPKTIGLGAAALVALCSAVGGAWLYARWQRERNKPMNRLRRGARDLIKRVAQSGSGVSSRLP